MSFLDKAKPKSQPSFLAKARPVQQKSLTDKVLGGAQAVSDFVVGKGMTEQFGADIARFQAPESQKNLIDYPTERQVAGSAIQAGSYLLPVGTMAKVGTKAVESLAPLAPKIIPKVAKLAGNIGAFGGTGYAVDVGSNLQEGKTGAEAYTPGLGTALGAAIPVGGAALGGVRRGAINQAGKRAPDVINSLIKPLSKRFAYGKDPGRAVSELGITANSLEELGPKITEMKNHLGHQLSQISQGTQMATVRVEARKALDSFDEAIALAVDHNDQALLNRLTNAHDAITQIFSRQGPRIVPVGSRLLDNLTYPQALKVKQLIGKLTKWTGQKTEDESVNGALARAYGALKDGMDKAATQVDPETAKVLRDLNQHYADLTDAEIAINYRDVLEKRHNLVNLPGKIGMAGAIIAAPFTGGVSTIAAALASYGIDRALSSAAFKTRLAKWLAKAGQADKGALLERYPQLRNAFPGDSFLQTSTGKKVIDYAKNPKVGLSIEDISKKES